MQQPQDSAVVRIGPYTIGRTLGIGSFCKVKLGTHEKTNQKVAIKILNRRKLKKMDMSGKVKTEMEIMRMFTHPHIIRLYEVIETPTDIFSVLEFVPGGELFDYIVSKGRLDETEGRRMFQEIISGVEYCHKHNVIHRDLKPENLLLDDLGHIKLADFGLSSITRDGYFLKTSCGSPNYAAPEVISGNQYAGPEVDVWSCGVILYAILCGSLPFDDEHIRNLFRKIKSGSFIIPTYVSAGARELITRMLIVDPLYRITIPEIREHQWFQTNLPSYLALSAEQQIERTQQIDETSLHKVIALGYQRSDILLALSMGSELCTSKKFVQHAELRQMAVLYNLILDEKRRKEQDLNARCPQAPEQATALVEMKTSPRHSRQDSLEDVQQTPACFGNHRWFLGREFGAQPNEIMTELYKALKRVNFEWKSLTAYRLKCRYPAGLVEKGRRVQTSETVKVAIYCYKTPRGFYLIDMQKIYGQTFLFLELCGKLMIDLRRLPLAPVQESESRMDPELSLHN